MADSISAGVTEEARRAVENERARRSPLNFEEMGISIGSTLVFARDDTVSATVADARKVEIDGEVVSLSPATRDLVDRDYYAKPTRSWPFEGHSLQDIYNETYTFVD